MLCRQLLLDELLSGCTNAIILGETESVLFKLGVMMFGCVHGQSPHYLSEQCLSVSDVTSRQHTCTIRQSSTSRLTVVPAESVWMTMGLLCGWWVSREPDSMRDLEVGRDSFRGLPLTATVAIWVHCSSEMACP